MFNEIKTNLNIKMTVSRRFLLCFLMACLLSDIHGRVPSDNDVASYAFDLDQFDDVVTTYMRERKIPGASVAVSRNGHFLVRKGYGRASSHRLMTPWALMRIGSVSKVVTAIGILRLYDERRLQLYSPVFGQNGLLLEFGSSFKDARISTITVLDLLRHTSGWDHRITGDPLFQRVLPASSSSSSSSSSDHLRDTRSTKRMVNKTDIVRFMLNQSLQYPPGTRYSYSNFGYTVLGLIIERVTGRSYDAYMKDVLRRKGIYRMKLGKTLKEDADISEVEYFSRYPNDRTQSVFQDGDLVTPPYGSFDMSLMDSTLGWIASAADLVRLFESIKDGMGINEMKTGTSGEPRPQGSIAERPLLSNETLKEMFAKPRYTNASIWYGMGVVVEDGGETFWHSGTLEGSTSVAAHDRNGFTWAALVNSKLEPNDVGDFLRYIIRSVFLSNQLATDNGEAEMEKDAVGVVPPESSSSSSPVGFHDPDVIRLVDAMSADGHTLVRLVIPDYKFSEVVTTISAKHYRLVWIDAFEEYGNIFFNAVWTQNDGTKWSAYHDLTSSRYRKRFKARVAQGYRLAHVETYVSRRRMRYAAVFVKDVWPEWTSYEGYSPHRHKTEFYRLMKDGYRLVVQSVAEYKGQLYVTAIYDRIYLGDSRVRLGLSLDEFSEELERHLSSGRILSYVQAYESRGLVKFSAIWAPKTTRYWAVSQTMTKYTLYNKLLEYAAVNVPLACVTAYHVDDVVHFAALWR